MQATVVRINTAKSLDDLRRKPYSFRLTLFPVLCPLARLCCTPSPLKLSGMLFKIVVLIREGIVSRTT